MPMAEQWLRTLEWLEVKEAEAEAAKDAREERANQMAQRELERGFKQGLGG